MIRLVLLWIHAFAGVIALVLGSWAAVRPTRGDAALMTRLEWAVGAMMASLLGAIAVDWPRLTSSTRLTFLGLGVLAGYTLWRTFEATRTIRNIPPDWYTQYLDHLGFVL